MLFANVARSSYERILNSRRWYLQFGVIATCVVTLGFYQNVWNSKYSLAMVIRENTNITSASEMLWLISRVPTMKLLWKSRKFWFLVRPQTALIADRDVCRFTYTLTLYWFLCTSFLALQFEWNGTCKWNQFRFYHVDNYNVRYVHYL